MSTIGESQPGDLARLRRLRAAVWTLGIVAGILVALLVFRVTFGRMPFVAPTFNGVVLQSLEPLPDFTLTGPGGADVSLSDFHGQVVLLYYGYTYCPDVCPATLAELKVAYESLSTRHQQQVQIIMISVDPQRDTPEQLADYMAHFHDDFIGLTGPDDALLAATTPLGIYYYRHEGSAASGYLIDHTASVAVVDRDGNLRLLYPFNTRGTAIAADLRQLLK